MSRKPNRSWVVEHRGHRHWSTCYASVFYSKARRVLAEYRQNNPNDEFRLWAYEPVERRRR